MEIPFLEGGFCNCKLSFVNFGVCLTMSFLCYLLLSVIDDTYNFILHTDNFFCASEADFFQTGSDRRAPYPWKTGL